MKTPEELLTNQLATCLDAMQDCLAHSREARSNDEYGHQRRNDLAYDAKLMEASAILTGSLARLKGETSHAIHVTRSGDKGEGDEKPRQNPRRSPAVCPAGPSDSAVQRPGGAVRCPGRLPWAFPPR